jgi:hypothetical protein
MARDNVQRCSAVMSAGYDSKSMAGRGAPVMRTETSMKPSPSHVDVP